MSKLHNIKNKDKLYAFMLNDLINFNIDELVTYIEDNYPGVDIYNIKRSYIHIQPNGSDINEILINFIISKVNDLNEGGDDIEKCIKKYIDVFFDITNKSDDVYIIEKMENN